MGMMRDIDVFTPNQYENVYYEAPIVAKRAPKTSDKYEIGKVWIDTTADDAYFLTNITAGSAIWINCGGGTGVFASLQATTGNITATLGNVVVSAGNLAVTLGTVTVGAFATAGIVTNTAAGLLATSAGTNGQVIIGRTGLAPLWATLTAGGGITITEGAGTITIANPGATGTTYTCTDLNVVVPDGVGNTDVLGYDANITTDGAVANTVRIRLADSITSVAAITATNDLTMLAGTCTVTSDDNAANAIYLHATGGVNETINIYSDAGTGVAAINVQADCGGLTFSSGLASADAINIGATNAAGGIDIDFGTGGLSVIGANGAINLESGTAAINVGADAAVHTVTVGSVTGGAATNLRSGTGNLALTSTGTITLDAAGVLELNSSAGIIGIGNDAIAQNINIGTGAAARTVTIGNTSAAGAVIIDCGTNGVSIGASATAHASILGSTNTTSSTTIQSGTGDVIVTSTDAVTIDAAGVLELNSSAGVIGIGNDAIAQNINIGTGAAARTVTIGNITDATAVNINSGTGGIGLVSTGAGDITINSDDTLLLDADGVLELNSSAGIISIGNDADNLAIGIGAGGERTVTVGGTTGASSVVVQVGTGPAYFGANATEHLTIAGSVTGASATTVQAGTGALTLTAGGILDVNVVGAVTIDSSGSTISIGADAVAQAMNIGTGGAARTITVGNVTGATAVNINSGTGGIGMASTGAGDITLTSADTVIIDSAGVLELNSSAGVISIGNDAVAQAINLGTGAAARTVTVGNLTAGSSLVLRGGDDGNIKITPATNTAAAANITLNAKVGVVTLTGLTTAAAASETFTITNDEVSATSGILVSVSDVGAADAQLTIQRVKPGAGSFVVIVKNNGAASLNGNVILSWIVLN